MKIIKTLCCIAMSVSLLAAPCGVLADEMSNPEAPKLGHLKGIKWKQDLPPRGSEHHDLVYGRLARPLDANGNFVSFDELAYVLKQGGVQAVAFRIDREDRYIDENDNGPADEMANYHNEIRLMTDKLEAQGIDVILFARMWLSRKKDSYVFEHFNSYLNTLTEAQRAKVDGISLTEIHLSQLDQVKTRALSLATLFEKKYPGWLKQRAFLMPGADNGLWFKGVNKRDKFHQEIDALTGEFAFVVKAMALKKKNDTKKRYQAFNRHVPSNKHSLTKREQYFAKEMGLKALVDYQARAAKHYPSASSIVFWGDNGDAMVNVHPKAAQALHNVLNQNKNNSNRGTFMYLGVGGENHNEDPNSPDGVKQTVAKSVLWYDAKDKAYEANELRYGKWQKVMPVFDQWNQWFLDTPGYWSK